MCGAVAVLGDMTKTRIYDLARWINAHSVELGFAQPPIPQASIDKPPSAELRPNQTDQDTLPPYDLLDQIIERYIELEQSTSTIIEETGFDESLVRKTAEMIDRAQFKRDQAPVILKVSGRAFGRGRPMPIVMKGQGLGMREQETIAREPAIGTQASGEALPDGGPQAEEPGSASPKKTVAKIEVSSRRS
jgi:NAD+ synthase (glutamine-hydrolysing)